jgi:hypothetical protein
LDSIKDKEFEICLLLGYYVVWQSFTDVSGQYISLIFKDQEVQEVIFLLDFFTLEDGTDTLSRNVGKGLPHDAA